MCACYCFLSQACWQFIKLIELSLRSRFSHILLTRDAQYRGKSPHVLLCQCHVGAENEGNLLLRCTFIRQTLIGLKLRIETWNSLLTPVFSPFGDTTHFK